ETERAERALVRHALGDVLERARPAVEDVGAAGLEPIAPRPLPRVGGAAGGLLPFGRGGEALADGLGVALRVLERDPRDRAVALALVELAALEGVGRHERV